MAIANRTVWPLLLQTAMSLCAAAGSAFAEVKNTETLAALTEDTAPAHAGQPVPLNWLEQPLHAQANPGLESQPVDLPATEITASQIKHIGRQREDLDLSANDSAAQRWNLTNDEPLFGEHWWQPVTGIAAALLVAVLMYMRHPIQRKRKYRRTPHEPTGEYSRRRPL
ncbi:hypothetical protein GCM10027277_06230 [Pseudoduganella ginsengisoli]|uniref:Uncharacterized protein n=1 Tax=Pseudoduganella ginsengisoli TaxID=1462440 RepID=A0A6L6Q5B4_9BURK|nr:hypothetical protein [Pseudoduganella ginsengisoli]MTW04322.1 hypothetical protein [Pseudoduganella ginsengisoli]